MTIGLPIVEELKKLDYVEQAEIAGSFRRCMETIGDLDFIVASSNPVPIMEWFCSQNFVASITAKGRTKSSIRHHTGIQMDLRVVPKKQYPYALLYFTGSKAHNIKLRKRALKMGYQLNEYGLSGAKIVGSEKEIYQQLDLPYVVPELREDQGELASKKLPVLLEPEDIRGVFHCHTTASDGHNTLEEMAQKAVEFGWEYLGISDHSKSSFHAGGLDEKRLEAQVEQIRKMNQSKRFDVHLFAGTECDILKDGSLDYSNEVLKELDFVIISIHQDLQLDEKTMTKRLIKAIENPYTTMVAHLTARLLLRQEPIALDIAKVIDACIANGKLIEINGNPWRMEMDWRWWKKAKEKGLQAVINPDAHSAEALWFYKTGVHVARKGWLTKEDVVNTYSLKNMQLLLE